MAISQRNRGDVLLVAGDVNTNLEASEGHTRDGEIEAALYTSGLEGMSCHFLPHHKQWLRDGRTCRMLRGEGRCATRLPKFWAQTVVYSKMWRYSAPDTTKWQQVIVIVQAVLCNGTMEKYSTCQTVIIIHKGDSGYFQGIGLVEML